MAQSGGHQKILLAALGTLTLFFVSASGAGAQHRNAASTFGGGDIVKLPIIDQQDIRFKRLSTANEASLTGVTTMAVDDQGFMWFGTVFGLYRYDGYRFKAFKHDPGRPGSLSGVTVLTLFKDRSGALWVGGQRSLDRFDPKTETCKPYRIDPEDSKEPPVGVTGISQDRAGILWLATPNGLRRLDPATGKVNRYRHDPNDPSTLRGNVILASGEDREGRFWVSTNGGLDRFDRDSGKVTLHVPVPANWNAGFYEDSAGVFWIISPLGSGLAVLDREKNKVTRYLLHEREPASTSRAGVGSILEDRAGNLWLGTMSDGLLKLDRERRRFFRYRNDPGKPDSLAGNWVAILRQDRQGNIWAGLPERGISFFEIGKAMFQTLWQESGNPNSPNNRDGSAVKAIYEDSQGTLWFGTSAALVRIDRKTGQHTAFRSAGSTSNILVLSVTEDSSGTLWVATFGQGLKRVDRERGHLQSLRNNAAGDAIVHRLLRDRSGAIWAATGKVVMRLDPVNETLTEPLSTLEAGVAKTGASPSPGPLSGISPSTVAEDQHGVLWIGTFNSGLLRFDPRTGQFALYNTDPGDPRSLSNARVNTVHADLSGQIWVGTQHGLNQLDPETGKFTRYFERDGLAGNTVGCLLKDKRGDLWIGSNEGISRFDQRTKTFKNYTVADGLPGSNFAGVGICYQSPSGELFFGGPSGAVAFHADKMADSTYAPPVVLTDFRLSGKQVDAGQGSLLSKAITHTTALTLTYRQNSFSLGFSALSYLNPKAMRYRYQLGELERQWIEVGSDERLVTYPATAPGRYKFRVQAASARGGWNEPGTELSIEILPPWWATWWFRSLMGLAFVGLVLGAYTLRVNELKRREKVLKVMVRERTAELTEANQRAEEATQMKSMFLANMSHEIRTPMNAVIGLAYLALKTPLSEKQRDYVNKIHNAGTSLLGVINDILDFSKIEAGKLDIEAVEFRLDDVIASVTSITAQKAQDKGLEFLAEVENSVPQNLVGDPLRLGQVIANLINNSIKFTELGDVYLKAELLERVGERARLRFTVKDTGIGMTPEQAARLFQPFSQADMSTTRKHGGTGLGLTICRRLVELMGGEIWLESEAGAGSTFLFTVSVGVASSPARGRIIPAQLRALSALVVDDNAAARDILVHALDGILARVDAVSSGEEAIAAVEQHDAGRQYDVVFMDWRMPGIDGIQAARLIKENAELKTRPAVVLVTAFGREDVREEAERIHIDGFLLKPVTASMLVDTLVTLFAGGGQHRTVLAPEFDRNADRLSGLRILLAEDNEINQQIAVELLEGVGATVEIANDGLEAVRKLLDHPTPPNYDVVLMDLQMPEMDGYQATSKIRSDAHFASFPIIAMTAHATVDERQKCLAAGMNGHVSKPIDPSSLFDTLERFVVRTAKSTTAPPQKLAPTEATQANELPDVPGLNTREGFLRVAGNKKLYQKLLRQFSKTEADAAQRIASALAENDRALAERLAHTIKGVAGNIGAPAVQNAAAKLEKAIAGSALAAEIEVLRASLEECLAHLMRGLEAAVEKADGKPAQAGDPAEVKEAVEQLSRYLAESNAAAIEYFEAVAPHLRILFDGQEFEHFASLVESYAFPEAYEELMAAVAANGPEKKI